MSKSSQVNGDTVYEWPPHTQSVGHFIEMLMSQQLHRLQKHYDSKVLALQIV